MREAFVQSKLVIWGWVLLCCGAACSSTNQSNNGGGSGTNGGAGMTSAATGVAPGGTTAGSGTGASGGVSNPMAGGSGETSSTIGTGGMGASGSGSGSGGMSSAGGTGGSGTGKGDAGMAADSTVTQCLQGIMDAGGTVGACEMCLCQPNNCQAELSATKGDMKAQAVLTCGKTNHCTDTCCLCSGTMGCDLTSFSNFADGPCAKEIITAAGGTPDGTTGVAAAVTNGTAVMNCGVCGGPTNPCFKASALSRCEQQKCNSECSVPACNQLVPDGGVDAGTDGGMCPASM